MYYIYIYIYIHTHTHTYTHIYTYIHTYTYIYILCGQDFQLVPVLTYFDDLRSRSTYKVTLK